MNNIENWHIRNDHPSHWRYEDQKLIVQISEGNIWGYGSPEVNNLFLHAVEHSHYAVQVDVNAMPKHTFEQAGLGVYWDDNNYIKISKEMFNGRLSLVFVTERNGHPQVNNLIDYPANDVTVRLEKRDDLILASYKAHVSNEWIKIGATAVLPGQERGVMLYTFSGKQSHPTTATFANFALDYL